MIGWWKDEKPLTEKHWRAITRTSFVDVDDIQKGGSGANGRNETARGKWGPFGGNGNQKYGPGVPKKRRRGWTHEGNTDIHSLSQTSIGTGRIFPKVTLGDENYGLQNKNVLNGER